MSLGKEYISDAIKKLRPNSEFSMQNRDYSTIQGFALEGDAPSEKEVLQTIELLKKEEIEKKDAAEAKLAALGLTIDDLRILGLG